MKDRLLCMSTVVYSVLTRVTLHLRLSGVRARKIAEANYNTEKVIETGRAAMREKTKHFRKKETDEDGLEIGM